MSDRTLNGIQQILVISTLLIFPFGEILKFGLTPTIRIAVLDLVILLFVLFSLFRKANMKGTSESSVRILLLFCGWAALTLLLQGGNLYTQGVYPQALAYLARFILYVYYFSFIIKFFSLQQIPIVNKYRRYIFLSTFFVALFGIIQYLYYPDLRNLTYLGWDPHYFRLFSTFFDPNFTGVILAIGIIISFSQNFFTQINSLKILYYLLLIIQTIALYLTRSRTAYLTLGIGTIMLALGGKKVTRILLLLATGIILAGSFPAGRVDVHRLLRTESSLARINNWKNSLVLFKENPLLGSGFGTQRGADSTILYILSATGIPGLLLIVYFFSKLLKDNFRNRTVTSLTSALLVSSFFNNTLLYNWILYLYFTVLALEIARSRARS